MKKLLSILVVSIFAVSTNGIISTNVNTDNHKKLSIINSNTNDFIKIKGINRNITSISFDNVGNGYIISKSYANNQWTSILYKCLVGQTNFKAIYKSNFVITDDLIFDNDSNIYFSENNIIYKSTDDGTTFNEIAQFTNKIINLKISANGTIYARTFKQEKFNFIMKIYKKSINDIKFVEISKIPNFILGVSWNIDNNNNLYISGLISIDNKSFSRVFKSSDNGITFTAMTGINNEYEIITKLSSDLKGNIYAESKGRGILYKCLTEQTTFTVMTGTNIENNSWITFDNDGNCYVVNKVYANKQWTSILYKCLVGQTTFMKMIAWKSINLDQLLFDKNQNMYLLSDSAVDNGKVYKFLVGQTTFSLMTGINSKIDYLALDKNQKSIYAFNKQEIYKSNNILVG